MNEFKNDCKDVFERIEQSFLEAHFITDDIQIDDNDLKAFIQERYSSERSDYVSDYNMDNYPMRNTLFECRYDINKEHAKASGFGVIDGSDNFKTILFVAGA